jgi:hypothetical protein
MSERFVLTSMILGSSEAIELNKMEFDTIHKAVDGLLLCVEVEENFDCIIENYRELEESMFSEGLRSVMSDQMDSIRSQAPRSTTARKLANLLSTVRLYCSTIETHTANIVGDASGAAQVKTATAMSAQFDSSKSYRIMDGLRNYAQHAALAVHSYSLGAAWSSDREYLEHQFEPGVNVAILAADLNFRRKLLEELRGGPPVLNLKTMARDYIECLSTIHSDFRAITQANITRCLRAVAEAKQRLADKSPDAPRIGVAIFVANTDGTAIGEKTNLSNTLTDYLVFLRNKNQKLINFETSGGILSPTHFMPAQLGVTGSRYWFLGDIVSHCAAADTVGLIQEEFSIAER